MRTHIFAPTAILLASFLGACSSGGGSSDDGEPDGGSMADAAPEAGRTRSPGPTADVSEELAGGNGPFIGAAVGLEPPPGFVDTEYVAAGTATSYQVVGDKSADGHWTFEPADSAAYRTRILVRRPADAASASGVVLVEWLNVSGGVDANPDYASLEEEIVRRGHTWIGVSAQLIGVEGGMVLVSVPVPSGEELAGIGLVGIDPERYDSLDHPGDGFSFDIFTQVARAAWDGAFGSTPDAVLALGESQSAVALTTYYNGVQPLTNAFDGFLIHSRGNISLPLVAPGEAADLVNAIIDTTSTLLRDDLDAPVMELQTEGDLTGVLNSVAVRQPDTDRFRLWEAAGTSHADAHLVGDLGAGIDCGLPINDGPMHVVAKAAFRGLVDWVSTGTPPLVAPRLEITTDTPPAIARDADGIALGGIRTPPVDVPVDVLSGDPGPSMDLFCILFGTTVPLPDSRIAELYSSRADYEQQYDTATDAAIDSGFVLEADRDALLGYAQPERVQP